MAYFQHGLLRLVSLANRAKRGQERANSCKVVGDFTWNHLAPKTCATDVLCLECMLSGSTQH